MRSGKQCAVLCLINVDEAGIFCPTQHPHHRRTKTCLVEDFVYSQQLQAHQAHQGVQ